MLAHNNTLALSLSVSLTWNGGYFYCVETLLSYHNFNIILNVLNNYFSWSKALCFNKYYSDYLPFASSIKKKDKGFLINKLKDGGVVSCNVKVLPFMFGVHKHWIPK